MSETLDFLPSITGSFATPAAENPTVAMVEAAYRHHGVHARYLNCDVAPESLADAVRGARAMGWVGFNCSLPHKVAVIEHLDELAASAQIIGAVNCVVRQGDRLVGENTDGKGFVDSLRSISTIDGARIVIFGAGGAARAIAVEAAIAGAAEIMVVNRDEVRGRALADLVAARTGASASFTAWSNRLRVPARADTVIDATNVGLYPDVDGLIDIDLDSLDASMLVADVIPNPPRTRLLREAEARGCRTLDGLGMLVNQGAVAIRLWTGTEPDRGVMRAALEEIFAA